MLESISATQWGGWLSFFEEEPFGPFYEDVRMARLMALLANVNRDAKKRSRPYETTDFMPRTGRPEPPSPKVMRQMMLTWALAHNAQQKKGI